MHKNFVSSDIVVKFIYCINYNQEFLFSESIVYLSTSKILTDI